MKDEYDFSKGLRGIEVEEECHRCHGIGDISSITFDEVAYKSKCSDCKGTGKITRPATVEEECKCICHEVDFEGKCRECDCNGTGKIRRPLMWGDVKVVRSIRGKHDIAEEGTVDLSLVLKTGGRLVIK